MQVKNVDKNIQIADMAQVAVFAALLAILSQFAIPLPSGVPMTLQTFAVALTGYTLGARKGGFAFLTYLLLGAVGVPVFANFKAGAMVLFGVTGGYLWGFLIMTVVCGAVARRPIVLALVGGLFGLALAHVLGLAQFTAITATPWEKAFMVASMPFLLKDVISVALAWMLARIIRRRRGVQ